MKLTPLGDKIIVRREAAEEVTAGGIVLPGSAQERPAKGRVLSVGDGRRTKKGQRVKPQVSEGDRVLFSSYSGTEVKVDGEDLLIMGEDDLLAVLE